MPINCPTSRQKAKIIGYAALNKKAIQPVILDLRRQSDIADYFVIASGNTDVQVRTIFMEIERACREEGIKIFHSEGLGSWTWVLLDMGDVIVHLFRQSERRYYDLEKLFQGCKYVGLPKL